MTGRPPRAGDQFRLVVAEVSARRSRFRVGARRAAVVQQIGEPSSRVADHEEALRLAFEQLAEAGVDLKSCGLLAVGHRVVHGGKRVLSTDVARRRGGRRARRSCRSWPRCTIRPRCRESRWRESCCPNVAHIAVFDTAFFHNLPAAAATYAIEPGAGRAMAHPPLRISRHVAPVRQRAGRRFPGQTAGQPESNRAASGQRRLGLGDRRRPAGRHLDGLDAAGGAGDGHPQRRHRPRRHQLPMAVREDGCGRDRVHAQQSVRAFGAWPVSGTSGGCTR